MRNFFSIQVSELRVSFPVHMCVDLPCLKSHLEAQPLPDGWIVCANSTTDGTLVFIKLSVNVDVLTRSLPLYHPWSEVFPKPQDMPGSLGEVFWVPETDGWHTIITIPWSRSLHRTHKHSVW